VQLFSFAIIFAGLFICRLSADAQAVSATLLGTVTDPSGAVIPGAVITAIEINTGASRSATSGSAGTYSIPYLAPGN
jgi:hypothetical protein